MTHLHRLLLWLLERTGYDVERTQRAPTAVDPPITFEEGRRRLDDVQSRVMQAVDVEIAVLRLERRER